MATLAKTAAWSETKPPLRAAPSGETAAAAAAAIRTRPEPIETSVVERSPLKAPTIKRTSAPRARMTSGRAMARTPEKSMTRVSLAGRDGAPLLDQVIDRGGGVVEDGVGIDAQGEGAND